MVKWHSDAPPLSGHNGWFASLGVGHQIVAGSSFQDGVGACCAKTRRPDTAIYPKGCVLRSDVYSAAPPEVPGGCSLPNTFRVVEQYQFSEAAAPASTSTKTGNRRTMKARRKWVDRGTLGLVSLAASKIAPALNCPQILCAGPENFFGDANIMGSAYCDKI